MSNSIIFYYPLMLLAVGYTVLTVAGRVVEGRPGGAERGSSLQTLGFALLLAAAAYVVVLLIVSVATFPVTLGDFAVIMITVFLFFGALLSVLLVLEFQVRGRALGVYVGVVLAVVLLALIVYAVVRALL